MQRVQARHRIPTQVFFLSGRSAIAQLVVSHLQESSGEACASRPVTLLSLPRCAWLCSDKSTGRTKECDACPKGEQSDPLKPGFCSKCPAGTVAPNAGTAQCSVCPQNTTALVAGSTACTPWCVDCFGREFDAPSHLINSDSTSVPLLQS